MEKKGFHRKLTAILGADVADFGISLQLHTLADIYALVSNDKGEPSS